MRAAIEPNTQFSGDTSIEYVRPIDGLRAIAVSAVVLYHSFTALAPSGLVGVDIFFVISGFVVSLSVPSLKATNFTSLLGAFFTRRILRIVPALLVCLLVTSAATAVFIPQGHLSETNLDTARAAFFGLSNFVLFSSSNSYFATRAELNPFTHTWSLAVEEQFYLLFPILTAGLLFICSRRWSRRATIILWVTLTIASAAVSTWQSQHSPVAAFYLLPARFWELGVGVLAYVFLQPVLKALGMLPSKAVDALAVVCVAIILLSLAFARSGFHYPFPAVAPAVLATAALICTLVAAPQGVASVILSHSVAVHLGRISYSLYLWHWPVFVLLRWTTGFTSPWLIFVGIALAFALAEASYRWVETPIRRLPRENWIRPAAVAASLAILVGSFGIVTWVSRNPLRFSASVTADRYLWSPEGATEGVFRVCDLDINNQTNSDLVILNFNAVNCRGNSTPHRLFVMGDSHAGAMIRIFTDAALSGDVSTQLFSLPGCGVLTLRQPDRMAGSACETFITNTFEKISREARPGDVLFLPSLRMGRLLSDDGAPLDDRFTYTDPSMGAAGLADAISKLQIFKGKGIRVVFSAPLPVFRIVPYRCADWFNERNAACRAGTEIFREEFERRRAAVMASLAHLKAQFPFVEVWDPSSTLCDRAGCVAIKNGKPLFYDGDHLSGWGNDVLYLPFISMLRSIYRD